MKQTTLQIMALAMAIVFGTSAVSAQRMHHATPAPKAKHHQLAQARPERRPEINPNTLIVFAEDNPKAHDRLMKAVKRSGAEVIYNYRNMHGMTILKPKGWSLEETRRYFEGVKGVLSVNYDYVNELHAMR